MRARELTARLDSEWEALAASTRSHATLARWASAEPTLADIADLEQLRRLVHDRQQPERANRYLLALVTLAARDGDRLAARVVLQLMLPGAMQLAHSIAGMLDDLEQALTVVLGELAIGIATYPHDRRRLRVAANLLLDTRQRIVRKHQRTQREVPLGLDPYDKPPATDGDWAATELRDLMVWAVRHGILTTFEVRLLLAYHVEQETMGRLATRFGRSRSALFPDLKLAEEKLRAGLHNAGMVIPVQRSTIRAGSPAPPHLP